MPIQAGHKDEGRQGHDKLFCIMGNANRIKATDNLFPGSVMGIPAKILVDTGAAISLVVDDLVPPALLTGERQWV